MSADSGRAKLNDAMKKLDQAWRRARQDWHDDVARRFEAERIEPLMTHTRAALTAVAPLQEVLHKARRACEPEDA